MEGEQSGPEKQDPTDEQGATQQAGGTTATTTTTAAVRSYECNFCKRGFTNAQALGGHMNIHRKDKAKLKQSSTAPSSDPLTPQPQHFPPSPNFLPPPNMFQTHPGKWTFSSSKDHTTDIHIANKNITDHEVKNQLSLLADHQNLNLPPPSSPAEVPPPELDLELRLGHNSDQPSSNQKGTRKFF